MEKVAVLVSTSAMISRDGFATSMVFPSVLPVLTQEAARKERRTVVRNKARLIIRRLLKKLVPSSKRDAIRFCSRD